MESFSIKNPVIYIYNTDTRAEIIKPPIKIGTTQNYNSCSKLYNKTYPYGQMVFSIEIPNANANLKTIENWIHTILAGYIIKADEFSIDIEEAQKIIKLQVYVLKLTNNANVLDRQLKIDKFVHQANKIINDVPDACLFSVNPFEWS